MAAFAATDRPALKGLDPVDLVEGKNVRGRADLRTPYGKFIYAFSTKAHQQKFLADPDRYAIQAEGKCLHMNQMEGDPDVFMVVEGKIYLAANTSCLEGARANPTAYVKAMSQPRKKVAVLIFPGVQIIDYTGPWEVFGEAGYEVFSVAASADPITTTMGMVVTPNYTFAASPKADILLIPGGAVRSPSGPADPTLKWIQQNAQKAEITMSVCNGVFWLAHAGLLDGLRATTTANHNLVMLAKNFPRITVVEDERFVDNGRIITTAGLSSGIDGALHVLEKLEGRGPARAVASSMEYDWRPESGYARGAMADKYLRRLGAFDPPQDVRLRNGDQTGDREHWESLWEIAGAQLTAQGLSESLDKFFARAWSKTGSSSDNNVQRTSWAFNGDDGKPWKALAMVKPAQDSSDKFVVTLSLEKAQLSRRAP
jgi:putative intracellular protease/amidase/YHS domain-containing protein